MDKLFKREKNKLWATYNKRLKKLHKTNFSIPTNNLEYFITYLKYLRDYYILTNCPEKNSPDYVKANTIASAIAEYELSQQCINKYYQLINGKITQIAEGTSEEIQAKFAKERAIH